MANVTLVQLIPTVAITLSTAYGMSALRRSLLDLASKQG